MQMGIIYCALTRRRRGWAAGLAKVASDKWSRWPASRTEGNVLVVVVVV